MWPQLETSSQSCTFMQSLFCKIVAVLALFWAGARLVHLAVVSLIYNSAQQIMHAH